MSDKTLLHHVLDAKFGRIYLGYFGHLRPLSPVDRTPEAVGRVHTQIRTAFEKAGAEKPLLFSYLRKHYRLRRKEILLCAARHPEVYGIVLRSRRGKGPAVSPLLYLKAYGIPQELAQTALPVDVTTIPLGLL